MTTTIADASVRPSHPAPFRLGIEAAAYEFPGERQDIVDWGPQHTLPAQRIAAICKSGCRYFHAAHEIDEVELAKRAVARLQAETGFKAADIGALFHVHTQQFSTPAAPRSLPLEVASAFGIKPFWVGSLAQLNCSSIGGAIRMAEALMNVHAEMQSVLIVSSDRVYGERFRLRQLSGIQSDGAACLLVTRNTRRNRIGALILRNYGRWYLGSDTNSAVEREMINLEWHYTRKVMQEAVAGCGIALSDFSCILPHNSDHKGWNSICNAMAIPHASLYPDNILQKGHACCSDLAVNLVDVGLDKVDAGGHLMSITQSNSGAFSALTLHPAGEHAIN